MRAGNPNEEEGEANGVLAMHRQPKEAQHRQYLPYVHNAPPSQNTFFSIANIEVFPQTST
jgi:hypothetical protein